MTIWFPNLDGRAGPRYIAIADALAEDIAEGTLADGAKLPTHRDLAYRIGVTVGTISRAYAEAERRGLVAGEVGRGTFVKAPQKRVSLGGVHRPIKFGEPGGDSPNLVDVSLNCPYYTGDSYLRATLQDLAQNGDLAHMMSFNPGRGAPRHREAGARLIGRLGWSPDPHNIVVTNGAQHALTVVLSALCDPGDVVLTESLTYPGIRSLAELLRLRLKPVQLDDRGMSPERLDEACAATGARMVCVQPTLHNPTTATMDAERRAAIAEIAEARDLLVIEDDLYAYQVENPYRPIATLIPHRTVFTTSVSKCLLPGLRTGYAVVPDTHLEAVSDAARTTNWMASPLEAEIAARWIGDGTIDKLIAERRVEFDARRFLLQEAFAELTVRFPAGAYHAWLQLPEPWTAGGAVSAARDRDVMVPPTEAFVVDGALTPRALRLSVAHPQRDRFEDGIGRLAELLKSNRSNAFSVV